MSAKPTVALKNFTDRDDEQNRLRALLQLAPAQSLPALNFYGVGGLGKTWLCRRMQQLLHEEFAGVKSAHIDFDTDFSTGARYIDDPSEAWFEIARQLKIPCPRFLLAYAVLQTKQKDTPLEHKKLSQGELSKVEWAGQLATEWLGSAEVKAMTDGVPLLGLIPFIARKGLDKIAEQRLKSNPDFQKLDAMDYSSIYSDLLSRLIKDLNAYAPRNWEQQCHSVVFFDTFESLGDETNKTRQTQREKWVRELARGLKRTLLVILGRNRLWWDQKPGETFWNQTQNLEQHHIKNLSESDARTYLDRCDIIDRALQDEVLRDSSCAPEPGYFPWTLGLCGDTLWQMREDRGDNTFPPAHIYRFEDGEHGPAAVVDRFLRTQLDVRRRWIERLAITLRFDEAAALNAYFATADERETAWERLREFSFLVPHPTGGWFSLHSHMRTQILETLSTERKQKDHRFWRDYWRSRAAGGNP